MRELSIPSAPGWQTLPLPNAEVRVWRQWLAADRTDPLYERLLKTLDWQQPTLKIAGKLHPIPRLKAWHGDPAAVYSYSGTTFVPAPWTAELSALRQALERHCVSEFNSVLANWYRDGADSMGLHADKETELGPEPVIASLSLGTARRFIFQPTRQEGGESVAIELMDGDLLLMSGPTQRNWRHGIPKTRRKVGGRINLTFRYIHPPL